MPYYQPFYGPFPNAGRYPYDQIWTDNQTTQNTFTATGTIVPSRFVRISGTQSVEQCTQGNFAFGISQEWTVSPFVGYAAAAGDLVKVYGLDCDCWLMLGGTVNAGDFLKPDDFGRGIASLPSNNSSARAYESGSEGDLIRVRIVQFPRTVQCGFSEFDYEFSDEFGVPCN